MAGKLPKRASRAFNMGVTDEYMALIRQIRVDQMVSPVTKPHVFPSEMQAHETARIMFVDERYDSQIRLG